MVDTRVSDLPSISAAEDTDALYVVDDPLGTPLSRQIDVSDALRLAHGQLSIAASSALTASAATWTQITAWDTDGLSFSSTPQNGNDRIVMDVVGRYMVHMHLTVLSASAQTVNGAIYWNNTIQQQTRTYTDGTNPAFLSVSAIVDVTSTATDLEGFFQNSAGAQVTFLYGQLIAQRIY